MLFDCLIIFIIMLCIVVSVTRGFIKELFAIFFLFLSILLTVNHYDFFFVNYNKYFSSELTINIFSMISVFIVLSLVFMIVNNWLMYILSPIRLGLVDRLTGMFLGAVKGIGFSFLVFFVIHLYYNIARGELNEEEYRSENVIPELIINSYSYQILFSNIECAIDAYIPESLILKIKESYIKSDKV